MNIPMNISYIKKTCLAVMFFVAATQTGLAIEWVKPNYVYHPRAMAMGNAFHAIADDEYALFSNPAGLLHNPKFGQNKNVGILTYFELGVRINQDLQDLTKFYKDNETKLSDPSSLTTEQLDRVLGSKAGIGMQGPLSVGYIGKNWGVAFIDTVDVNAVVGRDAPLPLLHLDAVAHASLVGGFALPLTLKKKDDLWFGIGGKFFYRGDINKKISLFELTEIKDIKDEFMFGNGFGIDVGFLYHISENWDIGISVQDVASVVVKPVAKPGIGVARENAAIITPNLSTGIAYRPNPKWIQQYIPEWLFDKPVFSLDYSNYFNSDYSIFTRLHLGMEIATIFHRLYLRMGLNQGYGTYGLGLDLYFFRIDFTYYRRELGVYPGDLVEESSIFILSGKF